MKRARDDNVEYTINPTARYRCRSQGCRAIFSGRHLMDRFDEEFPYMFHIRMCYRIYHDTDPYGLDNIPTHSELFKWFYHTLHAPPVCAVCTDGAKMEVLRYHRKGMRISDIHVESTEELLQFIIPLIIESSWSHHVIPVDVRNKHRIKEII